MKIPLYFPLFLGLLLILASGNYSFATKHRIANSDYQFTPKNLANVHKGDTIRWYWVKGMHTTTSDTIPTGAAPWDSPIDSLDTVFEYVPAKLGVFKYHCTPHVSYGMVGSFTVIPASGISNNQQEPVFSFFPNPVISDLFIHVESTESFIRDLMIYDISGKMIREVNFTTGIGTTDKTINLSNLRPGIYLLEFIDNHNKRYSQKITKL